MTEKKKSPWYWLNPLTWIDAILSTLLQAFGLLPPPNTEGFEDIERADIDDEARLAAEQQAAVDELQKEMSPAEIARAYAKSDAAGRATMDLSALGIEGQCWLLGLSDTDLARLGMSTMSGCARSLEERQVLPVYAKPKQPEMETAEILRTPTEEELDEIKRAFITARYQELFHAPGVANPRPSFRADTLH